MIPKTFKESNKELVKPENMTDQKCGPLPVFTNGNVCVSLWQMNFKERLHCFFHGFIWVQILSGNTQPPIAVHAEKSVFE
jgi:hypothetical protein